jgi:uncharacterized membrane protein YkoI
MRAHCPLRMLSTALLAVLISLVGIMTAAAREDDDRRDAVRRAVQSGDVLPLAQILPRVLGKVAGDVTGIEVERTQGRWHYEFRIIGRDGRVLEVHVDARNGDIERIEQK